MMNRPLRILLVEDSAVDTELLVHELHRGGFETDHLRVDSADALEDALNNGRWDLLLVDYRMPVFSGMAALDLVQEKDLDIPCILVSGNIGEEAVVSAMRAGAHDFVSKNQLKLLVPAVSRALEDAATRAAKREADTALRESEERFRQLAESISAVFFLFERNPGDAIGKPVYVSAAFDRIWGFPGEIVQRDPGLLMRTVHPADRARALQDLTKRTQSEISTEFRIVRQDLGTRWIHYRAFPVRNAPGERCRVAAVAEDVTVRKRAEQQSAENARDLEHTIEELKRTEEELSLRNSELMEAQEELEKRVWERTAELRAANTELQTHISERKRLEHDLLEIAEHERRRIGFDLHDDLGQRLAGVLMVLNAVEKRLSARRLPEARDARNVQTQLNGVVSHLQDITQCFTSSEIENPDLLKLIRRLMTNIKKTLRVGCQISVKGSLSRIAPEATVQLYKIVQEGIAHAVKQVKARFLWIEVAERDGALTVMVRSDGAPFRVSDEPGAELGLRIVRYRANSIGAGLKMGANGDSGFQLVCKLPLQRGRAGGPVTGAHAKRLPGSHDAVLKFPLATRKNVFAQKKLFASIRL